jgi:hypothetical protein
MAERFPTQVSVDVGAGHNLLRIDQWLSMPLPERTRLIIDDKVRFLAGATIIPIREALTSIKRSQNGTG